MCGLAKGFAYLTCLNSIKYLAQKTNDRRDRMRMSASCEDIAMRQSRTLSLRCGGGCCVTTELPAVRNALHVSIVLQTIESISSRRLWYHTYIGI